MKKSVYKRTVNGRNLLIDGMTDNDCVVMSLLRIVNMHI